MKQTIQLFNDRGEHVGTASFNPPRPFDVPPWETPLIVEDFVTMLQNHGWEAVLSKLQNAAFRMAELQTEDEFEVWKERAESLPVAQRK